MPFVKTLYGPECVRVWVRVRLWVSALNMYMWWRIFRERFSEKCASSGEVRLERSSWQLHILQDDFHEHISLCHFTALRNCQRASLKLNILIPPLPGKIWQIYARFNNQSADALHMLNLTNCKFIQSISCLFNSDCVLHSPFIVGSNIPTKNKKLN